MPVDTATRTIVIGALSLGILALLQEWSRKRRERINNVPHLFSWKPWLGHALELNESPLREFVRNNAKKAKNHKGVFTATIAGQRCLFVVDPKYISFVYKEIPALATLSFQKLFYTRVQRVTDPKILRQSFETERGKLSMDMMKHHMLKPEPLAQVIVSATEVLRDSIPQLLLSEESQMEKGVIGLYKFVSRAIFRSTMTTLLSKHIANDDVLADFLKVEAGVPLLFRGLPDFMVQDAIEAHGRLISVLSEPEFRNEEKVSPLCKDRDDLFHDWNSSIIAKNNVGLLVASASNSTASVFWTFYHIVRDKSVLQLCRDEILSALNGENLDDIVWTSDRLDKLQSIRSCFLESLRIYQTIFVVRDVVDDLVLNPKDDLKDQIVVQKGTQFMSLSNTMHMDETIYEEPEVFKPDRFLKMPLHGGPQFKPFGGGTHLCPGRKVVTYQALTFLAHMIGKYDVELLDYVDTAPDIDVKKQSLSVARPKVEVRVKISERLEKEK